MLYPSQDQENPLLAQACILVQETSKVNKEERREIWKEGRKEETATRREEME